MKRSFLKVLFVLMAALMVFSTIAAAPMGKTTEPKSLAFVQSRYVDGVGVVFWFDATGLTNADLKKASLTFQSKEYDLDCKFRDGDTHFVRCFSYGFLSDYSHQFATASIGGLSASVELPVRRVPAAVCPTGEVQWVEWEYYDTVAPTFMTATTTAIKDSAPLWAFLQYFVPWAQDNKIEYHILRYFCAPDQAPQQSQ